MKLRTNDEGTHDMTPYLLWCRIQRLFRVKRRLRMDKILRAELDMHQHARTWDIVAHDCTNPERLYVARYRAANCRHMESLLHKAWSAEYNRRPLESQELRDRVVELYRLGVERATFS